MAKSKAKSGASARKARPAKKPAAASKSKSAKRVLPIKKSSKPAKKAAPKKPVKKSVAKTKPHAKAAAKSATKPAPSRKAAKPAPPKKIAPPKKAAPAKKPQAKPAPVAKPVAHKPEPVKVAYAHPKPASKHERGAVAVAKAGSEPTVTKEDGRYALPATVNIDLPKSYRPSQKEEYMGPKQLAYFRNKLRDWRDQLVEESRQTMENLREEVRDVGDDAERATRETENSLELRTRDRYRKLISKIDKALRRIEEGRYGYCEETEEEIGVERLEARPIATLSLDAQERREHMQKQMGD